MAEYLRSDAEIRAAYGFIVEDFVAKGGDRGVIEPLVGARAGYLDAALEEVRTAHGSIEAYMREGLELDAQTSHALRAAFLEPA
jgi:protein-tyrosine phosphatase